MENVFSFRDRLIAEYSEFSRSFTRIAAEDIRTEVTRQYDAGRYWPEPLIQINPNYRRKGTVQQLAADGVLHLSECIHNHDLSQPLRFDLGWQLPQKLEVRDPITRAKFVGDQLGLDVSLLADKREQPRVQQLSYRLCDEDRLSLEVKTRLTPPKGVGDVFLKWLLRNTGNADRVHLVTLAEPAADEFDEFPDPILQPQFDPPDRKFAAVANAHPKKPSIWQAGDCKWLNWWPALRAAGIRVEFLCPDDARRFYAKKFPGVPQPALPKA